MTIEDLIFFVFVPCCHAEHLRWLRCEIILLPSAPPPPPEADLSEMLGSGWEGEGGHYAARNSTKISLKGVRANRSLVRAYWRS